jgi:hypothetical protein
VSDKGNELKRVGFLLTNFKNNIKFPPNYNLRFLENL